MNQVEQARHPETTIQETTIDNELKNELGSATDHGLAPDQDNYNSKRFEQGRAVRFAAELLLGAPTHNEKDDQVEESDSKNSNSSECNDNGNGNAHKVPTDAQQQHNIKGIRQALYKLNNRQNMDLSKLLELLVQFDELQGWRESGSRHCVAWMNQYLHIDMATGWDRLRVGRQLRSLPTISSLFSNGRLSWSKVRLLTRIANADNEQQLAHAALDASVSDVSRICDDYRWNDTEYSDNIRDQKQLENRSFTWRRLQNGNTAIRLELPPEQAQSVLLGIEQCEQLLYEAEKDHSANTDSTTNTDNASASNQTSSKQRKADAAVMMAHRSLAFEREDLPTADRFHVVLNVDVNSLAESNSNVGVSSCASSITSANLNQHPQLQNDSEKTLAFLAAFDPAQFNNQVLPLRTPMIEGVGPVSLNTARRVSCDCQITTLLTDGGDPLSIGSKSRIWPASMRTAIFARDRHCQYPGCTAHRHLHIHHIVHWADGGETSVENGVCLCQKHHQIIHSGDFEIIRADSIVAENVYTKSGSKHSLDNLSTQELSLNLASSARKKLLPTRCRFIVRRSHQQTSPFAETSQVAETSGTYAVCFDTTCYGKNKSTGQRDYARTEKTHTGFQKRHRKNTIIEAQERKERVIPCQAAMAKDLLVSARTTLWPHYLIRLQI